MGKPRENRVYIDPDSINQRLGLDWNKWLGDRTITTSEWFIDPTGPLLDEGSHEAGITSIRVNEWEEQEVYRLTNRVTASDGEGDDRSIIVEMWNR